MANPNEHVLFRRNNSHWGWTTADSITLGSDGKETWTVGEYTWTTTAEERKLGVYKHERIPIELAPGEQDEEPVVFYLPSGKGETFLANFDWIYPYEARRQDRRYNPRCTCPIRKKV